MTDDAQRKASDAAREYLLTSDAIAKKADLVGAHAAAKAAHQAAKEALAATFRTVEKSWDDMLKGGWTTEELAALGLTAPPKPRARRNSSPRKRKNTPQPSAESTPDSHAPRPDDDPSPGLQ